MYKKFYRIGSYLAIFNLGSCSMAAIATWLVDNNAYPDIHVTWKTWANIVFWVIASIVLTISAMEKNKDESIESTKQD